MSMYKDLVQFSDKYKDKMFSAYTRVWEVGEKLVRCWNKLGYNYPNPFCAEDEVLPSVELKQAMQIIKPYWNVSPLDLNKPLDARESDCVNIACDILMRYIKHVCPKAISVCLATGMCDKFKDFDYVFSISENADSCEKLLLDSDLHKMLSTYEGCDMWIEGSRRVLNKLGVRALNYTIFNQYSMEPITKIMFTNKREYVESYEDYLVIGWNSSVRQYSSYICDIRENVVSAHYMHFKHESDDEFESSI